MRGIKIWSRIVCALSASCLFAAMPSCTTGQANEDKCWEGMETCPCYPNYTCDSGLSCEDDVCVSISAGGSAGAQNTNAGGSVAAAGAPNNPAPKAPRILSLSANTNSITKADSLVISVVATDPDGIDDVIGGTVKEPNGRGTYGTLASSAAEGAYSLALNWTQINTVSPINGPPTGENRVFRIQIFDVAGNSTEQDITISLQCSIKSHLCAGECTNLKDTWNCGECGKKCADDEYCPESAPFRCTKYPD